MKHYATMEQHRQIAAHMDEASRGIRLLIGEGDVTEQAGVYLLRALHSIHAAREHLQERAFKQHQTYFVSRMHGQESFYKPCETYKEEARAQYEQGEEPITYERHQHIARVLRCARAEIAKAAHIGMRTTPKHCYLPLWRADDNIYLAADEQYNQLAAEQECGGIDWRMLESVYLHECPETSCSKRGEFC